MPRGESRAATQVRRPSLEQLNEDDWEHRASKPRTPPSPRTEASVIMVFNGAKPSQQPGEQQTLVAPPKLPRAKVVRAGSSPRRTQSGRATGARAEPAAAAPGATFEVEGPKVDKVSQLFASLEKQQDDYKFKTLRRIFGHIFDPQSRGKRTWDLFVLLLVFFSTLYEPYKAAFRPARTDVDMVWWEWVVDGCFYADIVLCFMTGFDKGYEIVMVREEIVRNYVGSGWFFIDLIATVQWDILIAAVSKMFGGGGSVSSGLQLTRLIKVVRLVKAPRLIDSLTKMWTLHTVVIGAFKFFVLVLIVAHILGCFFFMVPALALHCVPAEYTPLDQSDSASVYGGTVGEFIDGHSSPDCEHQCGICDPDGAELPDTIGIIPGSWRHSYDVEQLPHYEQYIDALYWSLTTMTTIGYGDRGPQLKEEILYTMGAEIVGLSFFAMLLNQIAALQQVLNFQQGIANDEKNGILEFLKHNALDGALIHEVVEFLNFKTKGHSGHALKESDYWKPGMEHFRELSEPLRQKIKEEIFIRPLREVRLFGHSKKDKTDQQQLKKLFDGIDTDGGGSLDQEEITKLLESLGIHRVTPEEVKDMMVEMTMTMHDIDSANMIDGGSTDLEGGFRDDPDDVTFEQFQAWWYFKKHGRPKMPKCPLVFLQHLASDMSDRLKPYGKNEQVVGRYAQVHKEQMQLGDESHKRYGDRLAFIMTGTVMIVKNPPRQHDIVVARQRGPGTAGPNGKIRPGLLFRPGQRGKVVPGSVNPILRTCKVLHLNSDDSPRMHTDAHGATFPDVFSYSIVDLQVVHRHRPRYYVCDNLKLLAHPGEDGFVRNGGDDDDEITDINGSPVRLGGVVPAKETVREAINPATLQPWARARNGGYVLVTWSTENGKITGWARDPLTARLKKDGSLANAGSHDGEISGNEIVRWVEDTKMVSEHDEEPVFGLAAALDDEAFRIVEIKTKDWFVETLTFVDMAYITRDNLHNLLQDHWPSVSDRATNPSASPGSPDGRSSPTLPLDMSASTDTAAAAAAGGDGSTDLGGGLDPVGSTRRPGSSRGCCCGIGGAASLTAEEEEGGGFQGHGGSSEDPNASIAKVGGQQALEMLALMDHNLDQAAPPTLSHREPALVTGQHNLGPQSQSQSPRQASGAAAPGMGGVGKFGSHKLRDITKKRMKTIINPVRSFEDCAKRFDSIERNIDGVAKNVNEMMKRQADMQQAIMAELVQRREPPQEPPQELPPS